MTSNPSKTARPPVILGALWMLGAMSAVAVVDGVAKYLGAYMSAVQVTWIYFMIMLVGLLVVATLSRTPWRELVRSGRPGLQAARGGCLIMSLSCLFYSLQHLPLAEATTISFTSPLIIVALSGPLLGEKVGWQRWLAVLVGMLGAIIVARPGMGVLHWSSAVTAASAFFFASFTLITRMLGATDRPLTTLFYTFATGTVLLSWVGPVLWTPVSQSNWLVLIASGVLGLFAHFAIFRSLTLADASIMAPINYIRLVWAAAIGVVLFADYPDIFTLIGGSLTVASGLYVVRAGHRSERSLQEA